MIKELEIKRTKIKDYLKAAFYSSGYFVCSVFALSQDTLIAPAIFATIPFINVWFDPKNRLPIQKKVEYISSFILLIGLLLIAHII